jgi:hypothetical protein
MLRQLIMLCALSAYAYDINDIDDVSPSVSLFPFIGVWVGSDREVDDVQVVPHGAHVFLIPTFLLLTTTGGIRSVWKRASLYSSSERGEAMIRLS